MIIGYRITLLLFAILLGNALNAQELKFNSTGTFKIIQFTDIHYAVGTEGSKKSISLMQRTLDEEQPDVVVFTGDIVVKAPTEQGWDEVLDVVISRNIPYLVTLGNHDDESEWTREEVARYVASKPLLLNKDVSAAGVDGFLNGAIAIRGQSGIQEEAILYAMDSKAYSTNEQVKGYGWFAHNQVQWYLEQSAAFKQRIGRTLPALAFFHIPLPEYRTAFDDLNKKRVGVRYEAECPPEINTGMYAAMFESGDVLGTFVGHDHVNDYLVDYLGIALAYGCFSGSENTYQRTKPGARVIILSEGERQFETYLREQDGTELYRLTYPFADKQ